MRVGTGLEDHEMWIARRNDLEVTEQRLLRSGASVPDGAIDADGTVHLYWVDASDHQVHHGTFDLAEGAPIEDGVFEDLGPITVDGAAPFSGLVDPDIGIEPDGTFRLVVFDGFGEDRDTNTICELESTDGQRFTTRRTLIESPGALDPSMVVRDDTRLLIVGSAEGESAPVRREEDGAFTEIGAVVPGGAPELAIDDDGTLLAITCEPGGVALSRSDDGTAWVREGQLRFAGRGGCDPSVIAGTDLFLFKAFAPGSTPPGRPQSDQPQPGQP